MYRTEHERVNLGRLLPHQGAGALHYRVSVIPEKLIISGKSSHGVFISIYFYRNTWVASSTDAFGTQAYPPHNCSRLHIHPGPRLR